MLEGSSKESFSSSVVRKEVRKVPTKICHKYVTNISQVIKIQKAETTKHNNNILNKILNTEKKLMIKIIKEYTDNTTSRKYILQTLKTQINEINSIFFNLLNSFTNKVQKIHKKVSYKINRTRRNN